MDEQLITKHQHHKINELFTEFSEATNLTRPDKANKLMAQIDMMIDTEQGIEYVYDMIDDLTKEGLFLDSPWSDPSKLVATLVNGTLKSGHPNSTIEILSELRLLAIAKGKINNATVNRDEAENYIQEVIVSNLEFVFNEPLEETRLTMSDHELLKVHSFFKFVSDRIHLDGVKMKLAEELTLICEQRPVVTEKQRKIIELIKEKIDLDPEKSEDAKLYKFQRSIYSPTNNSKGKSIDEYNEFLNDLSDEELKDEAKEMGRSMNEFGLVSRHHAVLLLHILANNHFHLVPPCLGLNPVGKAKWNEYSSSLSSIIMQTVHPYNTQCIYGLAKMLEKGIISREAVRSGLFNLATIKIHPKVEDRIIKSTRSPHKDVTARQYLIGALFRILGQPLGVGQGNNPTCQSARGISMWSEHAPAKLINMIQTAAVHNDLMFRFEGHEIKASLTGKGLVQKLDHNLDAVSVTLVPMLDKIYNEMMLRASGRGEDPHKWVNPALYGQWIQIGFASAYDYLTNAIVDFDGFVRVFYSMAHPEYNGGHRLIYPNPVGIFITSNKGEMLGFHAVSLLRVEKAPNGIMRAYFLNPNNEGRQDWGQEIKPSVFGNGELHGESSLPIHEFAARTYAFHFNSLEVHSKMELIPSAEVRKVKQLAQESWGQAYNWLDTKKQW
ncbi:hypothetical protein OO013_05190 [Mangrovivirga sp. M17]|uniref:Uncharacterized protein n=1 Tax=Mangrovivirga halotolerans TaxID=2993936 RepID=A0ABT3RPH3_9BACT|nr:hypothetical protein [Mangrovivirga halotolerans]MCX2743248.1 hypothetical protein [Mangrovivirga halotolerans]